MNNLQEIRIVLNELGPLYYNRKCLKLIITEKFLLSDNSRTPGELRTTCRLVDHECGGTSCSGPTYTLSIIHPFTFDYSYWIGITPNHEG
jgi:hypothetical protein